MFYYGDSINNFPIEIDEDKFEEIFKNLYEHSIPFEDAYCCIDPYYSDIDYITKPLISDSEEGLKKLYQIQLEEI